MNDLVRGVLSCLFISIPETTFMIILLMKLSGRKELLDIYRFRENIKWYIILIIPPSILLDTLNYEVKIQPKSVSVIISLSLLYLLSIFVFKKTAQEEVKYLKSKIFICFIPLYISLIFVDLLTAPVLFHLLNYTYTDISKDIYLMILCSIPSKIIEFTIITFILVKRNSKFQINLINYVSKNNFFRRFSIIMMTFLLIFEICILKFILYNNLLGIFKSLIGQILFIIFFTYLIPILILMGFYLILNHSIILLKSVEQDHNRY